MYGGDKKDYYWSDKESKYDPYYRKFIKKLLKLEKSGYIVPWVEHLKSREEVEKIKKLAKFNSKVLDYVNVVLTEGITTEELDTHLKNKIKEFGAIPAPMGFEKFPTATLISINSHIENGLPCKHRILQSGDILNVESCIKKDGVYAVGSRMYTVGNASAENLKLLNDAKGCLYMASKAIRPWQPMGNMSEVLRNYITLLGYNLVEGIGGHGTGRKHEEEPFLDFTLNKNEGMIMAPGMVISIKLAITTGSPKTIFDRDNILTVITADGSHVASCSLMLLIKDEKCELISY